MNQVKTVETRKGVDVGYHGSNVVPIDREGCVGKAGIDKTFTFEMVVNLASKLSDKPNIIIKAGPNAKWYLKRCPVDEIDGKIEKEKWRDTSRCTMYVVEWE